MSKYEDAEKTAKRIVWAYGADEDLSVGLIVQYIGDEDSGTVEVSSSGDITFKHGDLSSEVVDTTIDSGTWDSGTSDPGVIDVSDSSNMTGLEVENLINGSTNWRARLTGLIPDDNMNASTGTLLLRTAAQAKVDTGVKLLVDGTKPKFVTIAITGVQFDNQSVNDGRSSYEGLRTDDQCENWLDYASCTNTSSSNDSEFRIYEVAHGDTAAVELYANVLATATKEDFGDSPNPSQPFFKSSIGHRLVCRIFNPTDALTINEFQGNGRVVDYGGQPRAL